MKEFRLLPTLLAGYLFLLIFRPYEYWPVLGEFRVERVYMLCFMAIVFLSKEKRFLSSSLNGVVLFFSVALLVSGIFSISWDNSWRTIEDYLKCVVFYFMVILCVRDDKDFRFMIVAFIGVMFLYVGKSAWEFFVHGRHVYRMGISRMIGIDVAYGDPNSFAATICYSLPLTWAAIQAKLGSKKLRFALWAYACLACVAIVLTGSRSGMVTALLFVFIIFMISSKKIYASVFFAVMLLTSWHFMPDDMQTRFLSVFYDDLGPENAQSSAASRLECFLHGMKLFAANPFLGVGPGNFPLTWESRLNAHNLFGQLLGEVGLLGGGAFFLMIVIIVFKNLKIINTSKNILEKYSKQQLNEFNIFERPVVNKMNDNYKILHVKSRSDSFFLPLKTSSSFIHEMTFFSLIAQAIIQTIVLMVFKGWGDHNLYRYTWLWLAALAVLGHYLFFDMVKKLDRSK